MAGNIQRERRGRGQAEPLVSVIIIFLNGEKYLAEAIESVRAQSFEDWELLLVDDGSSDGSTALAQRYAQSPAGNIHYLEHPGHENRGMSAARNLGLRSARGKYVTFLDADDAWQGEPLATMVPLLEHHPEADLTFGLTYYWYNWWKGSKKRDHVQDLRISPGLMIEPPKVLVSILRDGDTNPAGILWRRAFVESVGGYEEQFRGMFEDQAFHAKAFIKARALVADGCWYKYRKHPESCCAISVASDQADAAMVRYLDWLEAFLDAHHLSDPELKSVVRLKLLAYRHPKLYHFRNRLKNGTQRARNLARRFSFAT